jgi:hypothetical protein
MTGRDWLQWHKEYDTWPELQKRLHLVQSHISGCLTSLPPGPISVISVCAGDGRDLCGVLSMHPSCPWPPCKSSAYAPA